jgi:hypothetical protein
MIPGAASMKLKLESVHNFKKAVANQRACLYNCARFESAC